MFSFAFAFFSFLSHTHSERLLLLLLLLLLAVVLVIKRFARASREPSGSLLSRRRIRAFDRRASEKFRVLFETLKLKMNDVAERTERQRQEEKNAERFDKHARTHARTQSSSSSSSSLLLLLSLIIIIIINKR